MNRFKDYEQIRRTAHDIIEGRKSIIRLDERGEKGCLSADKTAVESTCYLGESRRTTPALYEESEMKEDPAIGNLEAKEEKLLTDYAKSEGNWLDYNKIKREAGNQLPSGAEADVFVYSNIDDTKYVIKVVNYKIMSLLPSNFLDNRIALYNALFPETKYELLGFTKNKDNDFCFVLKQPFVEGTELVDEVIEYDINNRESNYKVLQEINDFLDKTLNLERKDSTTFASKLYIIEDVHLRNVMRQKDTDFLVFIDVVPSLNTANDEYQGENFYREFEIVKNIL